MECHQGPSADAVAQSVPAVAHRDLHRRQDEGNRISGILGIHVARTPRVVGISEVDRGDGALDPSQAEGIVILNFDCRFSKCDWGSVRRRIIYSAIGNWQSKFPYAPLPAAAPSPRIMFTSLPLPAPVS